MLNSSALSTEVVPGAAYAVFCFAQSVQGVSETDDSKKLTWVGSVINLSAISEICTNPFSLIPTSTKQPKAVMLVTFAPGSLVREGSTLYAPAMVNNRPAAPTADEPPRSVWMLSTLLSKRIQ